MIINKSLIVVFESTHWWWVHRLSSFNVKWLVFELFRNHLVHEELLRNVSNLLIVFDVFIKVFFRWKSLCFSGMLIHVIWVIVRAEFIIGNSSGQHSSWFLRMSDLIIIGYFRLCCILTSQYLNFDWIDSLSQWGVLLHRLSQVPRFFLLVSIKVALLLIIFLPMTSLWFFGRIDVLFHVIFESST